MGSSAGHVLACPSQPHQNVVVMRHGDRLDNFAPLWAESAPRPWDPPLVDDGKVRAFGTGQKLRTHLGFPVHRVFVSPFLRCLQTAAEVVTALCAVSDKSRHPNGLNSNGIAIDPSKIKVSIEYGLSEMMNSVAIREPVAPKDGIFIFSMSKCEAVIPAGTVDKSIGMIYKELPRWPETVEGAKARYLEVIKALADKYPSENLLLVTHGEGVRSVVCGWLPDFMVSKADYCAYSILRRPISSGKNETFTLLGSPKGMCGITLTKLPKEGDDQSSV